MLPDAGVAIFVVRSLWNILLTYTWYLCGWSREQCLASFVEELSAINIFYVKLLQILSTNAQLFTDREMGIITRYTDEVPYDNRDINTTFRKTITDVGNKCPELQLEMRNHGEPIKSGTISLVYEGYMNSRRVAIKVIRNDVEANLQDAFVKFDSLLRLLVWILSIQNLNLHEILSENRASLLSQTNFETELSSIQRMKHNFRNIDYVIIPTVYPQFTEANSTMIVMDYIAGYAINMLPTNSSHRDEYAVLFAKYVSKCIFFDRFFHADLHPGNIRFIHDKDKKQLGILDFGIMGEITREEQDAAYQAHVLVGEGNWDQLAQLALKSYVEPKSAIGALSEDDKQRLLTSLVEEMRQSDWSNMGPRGLFAFSQCLQPYGLSVSKSFSKLELAICVSASVHLSLGKNTDFKTAMAEASCKDAIWEY